MKLSRKLIKLALPGLLATAGMVVQTTGPAAAAHGSGTMTGWEGATAIGPCGLPESGFAYSDATFYLRDSVANPDINVTVGIGPFLAAPQGAAPGGCGDPLTPIVPFPVAITSATVDGSACTATSGDYTRVNNNVTITFTCNGETWAFEGTQNPCNTDPLDAGVPPELNPSPECNADPSDADQEDAAGYNDPVVGGAGSHFVLVYTHVDLPV